MTTQKTNTPSKREVKPRKTHTPLPQINESEGDSKVDVSTSSREELIRQTAYALYEARHCVNGFELDDWLHAEARVSQMKV